MSATNDDLKRFAERFLSGTISTLRHAGSAVQNEGAVAHFTLYQDGPFQVEQYFVLEKSMSFPAHRHPNVETIEFTLCGDLLFFLDGQECHSNEQLEVILKNGSSQVHDVVRIQRNQEHWVNVGRNGGVFLSIQKWATNRPGSVVLDWDGEAFSDVHSKNVSQGNRDKSKQIHEQGIDE
jgi:quercetin dioxygenase-like cupin family protein